ncbi:hypothetical protein Tco_0501704 [Tanacetum coccineum]
MTVPIAEHSRKCIFSENHDHCVTKFLNEVNSRAKIPSNKTTNRKKPVEQTSFAKKPKRQIPKGHRFLIKKTSVVNEKTITPRSCHRWKPTGKIFKTVGLRWVPTGKIFTSSTTKVDNEPTNGSNEDITNKYECEQTLDVSAGTLNLSTGNGVSSLDRKQCRMNFISWRTNQVWELVDNLLQYVIKIKVGYGKTKKDEDPKLSFANQSTDLLAKGYALEEGIDLTNHLLQLARFGGCQDLCRYAAYKFFSNLTDGLENGFLNGPLMEEFMLHKPDGFVDLIHSRQVYVYGKIYMD